MDYMSPVPNSTMFPDPMGMPDPEAEMRRKYAAALREQALTPLDTNQKVAGHTVPVSGMQGLAQILQGYMAGKMMQPGLPAGVQNMNAPQLG